jgi:nucleoside-diphosphate-sugar epimerase
MRIFVAGATGVIGKPLMRLLVAAGHDVTGTTRSAAKAADIKAMGAKAAVVDVFDAEALKAAVAATQPEAIIHQLTDLPDSSDPAVISKSLEANARIRIEGTYNLIVAAKFAGARRFIAQSIGFLYTGDKPHQEGDPIKPAVDISARGVHALEGAVTGTPGIDGVVLRYGKLFGPGTWNEKAGDRKPEGTGYVHVDAAAQAALLAVTRGAPGIYNIAEDDGELIIGKARQELGFDPAFRLKP